MGGDGLQPLITLLRAKLDAALERLIDEQFPPPFFWLGRDADWPELVWTSEERIWL